MRRRRQDATRSSFGQLRSLSTTVTNEYLASHGYVIAMVDGVSPDIPDPGAGLELALRDMEFIVPAMRKLPFVDPTKLAALGFSGSGFSQILFAMRHPDVDAVSDLESAIFDDGVFWPLSGGWGYSVTAMRVPFLHMYSVPLSKRENRFAEFEAMRYSNRHHYLVDAPGIHHWDFATEGMAASTVLGMRGANANALAPGVRDDKSVSTRVLQRIRQARRGRARVSATGSGGERSACRAGDDPRARGSRAGPNGPGVSGHDRNAGSAGRAGHLRRRPHPRSRSAALPGGAV
jgi:hypothetical protein